MSGSPLISAYTRVFIIPGRARGDHKPVYESCVRMQGVSQGFGDVERVECPDPSAYGEFVEVAQIVGATERPKATLEGRYAMDVKSALLEYARLGCEVDVQLHIGTCEDPSDSNSFKKAIVLEGARLTNFSTDELGALTSGDNKVVNEKSDISARDLYELLPVSYGVKAASIVTNEAIDVAICDTKSCGECTTESDGCKKIFVLTKAAGGSPSTPADIVFSLDKGITWYAHDIDSLGAAIEPDELDCVGNYLVVVSFSDGALHYVLKSALNGITDPTFTKITTGIVAGGKPYAIKGVGSKAFIVGAGGYIYETEDPTAGVTVLDAGSATVNDLKAVDAISRDMAVAVGNNGAIVYTLNGSTWAPAAATPVGVGINLLTVAVKSEDEWWVGTSNGKLFYTLDKGNTWTEKSFSGGGTGSVLSLVLCGNSEMWMAHQTAATKGRILRSYDGGYSWVVTPEGTGSLPLNDKIDALAVCESDPNFVVGVGLADDAADGFIVVGQAV